MFEIGDEVELSKHTWPFPGYKGKIIGKLGGWWRLDNGFYYEPRFLILCVSSEPFEGEWEFNV